MKNFIKMDLQARKIIFVQEFLRLENEEIVNGLEDLLRKKKAEHYNQQLKPMNAAQFNDEIDLAIHDSNEDRITSAKELRKKVKQWR
jgi:hypothetical protein